MQRVLESKTNLTKFARFYLMILSHTSIIIYHYQRCCRIPLLQPQLILTSSTSPPHNYYRYYYYYYNHCYRYHYHYRCCCYYYFCDYCCSPAVYNLLHAYKHVRKAIFRLYLDSRLDCNYFTMFSFLRGRQCDTT